MVPVDEILAYCGLVCQTCPIFLATRQEDKVKQAKMRQKILRLCNERYGLNYALEDISDCDGCRTDGERLFLGCKDCTIRQCAREKKLENCAYCTEYACGKLEAFFRSDPIARKKLDAIRTGNL